MSLKQNLFDNFKNLIGQKSARKFVVFSVDDYGNVRLDSAKARKKMDEAGFKVQSRFDAFDALETREDLQMLFDTLSSVRDRRGRHAVFTPFALPCNIDFEKVVENNYTSYQYELLPATYKKLEAYQPTAYEGAWSLWLEGKKKGLMAPQFHGREHLNLKVLKEKLAQRNNEVLTALANRSYTGITSTGHPSIRPLAAFDYWDYSEIEDFEGIIEDGLNAFEKVFGYRALHFNSPAGGGHCKMHSYLYKNGIRYADAPLIKKEHQGRGKYKRVFNYSGKKDQYNMTYQVRNVVFEPTEDRGIDWVDFAMKQIEAAFRWNRPAIVSSHRVNFCGHIDPANRKEGISSLHKLLQRIVQRWPEVEFLTASELAVFQDANGKKSGLRVPEFL